MKYIIFFSVLTSGGNYKDIYMEKEKLKKEIAQRFMKNEIVSPKRKFHEIAIYTELESKCNKPNQE
jgi:hypothetical protein